MHEVTVYKQTTTSSVPRTITAKVIGWTGNLEGAMELENLATRKKVTSVVQINIHETNAHRQVQQYGK